MPRANGIMSSSSRWIFGWVAPSGFNIVWGKGTPFPGVAIANEGVFQDIVANRRIVTSSRMALGEKCISASLVTIEFLADGAGTKLIVTHQAAFFEGADCPQMREGGWRHLLEQLAKDLAR